jgi:hypothetical protein
LPFLRRDPRSTWRRYKLPLAAFKQREEAKTPPSLMGARNPR